MLIPTNNTADAWLRQQRIAWGLDRIGTGVLAHAVGFGLVALAGYPPVPSLFWLGVAIAGLGWPILISGCVRHAGKKEYRAWVGAALGLLSVPGTFVVLILPRRNPLGRRGFEVMTPRRVVDTWVTEDPRQAPRPWAPPEQMAELWQKGKKRG